MVYAKKIAVLALIAWVIMASLSRAYISDILQEIDPFVFGFYAFILTFSFYFLLATVKNKNIFRKIRDNFRLVWIGNLSTFFSWFFIIYPLKYISPSLVSASLFAMEPLAIAIFQPAFLGEKSVNLFGHLPYCFQFFLYMFYLLRILISAWLRVRHIKLM